MIIYNSTVKVNTAIAAQWLEWLQQTQAPEMLATGCFSAYHVLQLLELDDSEGPTYAVQFQAHSRAAIETFRETFEDYFQQQTARRWGSAFVSFNTLMEQIV